MTQIGSLAWKEWREAHAYLWIGLGVFLGIPLEVALYDRHATRHFDFDTTGLVIALGGVLAMFVGVGITCRDLTAGLENFWRSRPISTTRWLLTKYLIGLAIVLAACVIPPVVQWVVTHDKDVTFLVLWFPFLWIAVYSGGFLAGCLARRTSHAAILAFGGMLLIFFLPILLPPLAFMRVSAVMENHRFFQDFDAYFDAETMFAAGMLGLGAILTTLAVIAVKRSWVLVLDRKTIFASIILAFLLLFSTAAFHLATNMPILQTINLPDEEKVEDIRLGNDKGYVFTSITNPLSGNIESFAHSIELTKSAIKLGPRQVIQFYVSQGTGIWSADHPDVEYGLFEESEEIPQRQDAGTRPQATDVQISYGLSVKDILKNYASYDTPLLQDSRIADDRYREQLSINNSLILQKRLYVPGRNTLAVVDISQPREPRVVSVTPFNGYYWPFLSGRDTQIVHLPSVPDLSPIGRVRLVLNGAAFDGTSLCVIPVWLDRGVSILLYRLQDATDRSATFVKVAEYQPNFIDAVFNRLSYESFTISHGWLYGRRAGGKVISPNLSVYDLAGPEPLREIGHFAVPGMRIYQPLPDGRMIAGGTGKLWLVGPPPKH